MDLLRKISLKFDTLYETVALLSLTGVILVVCLQVITRKLFNFVFFWSEEVTMLLLVWFSFMGIAIGFREGLHMGIDSFTDGLPVWINQWLDKFIEVINFAVGIYLIYYGWQFTELMHNTTLAATKLPNSVVYVVMPITGVMTCIYSALHIFGKDTRRHRGREVDMDMGTEVNN